MRSLEEPASVILQNAGYDARPWLHEIDRAPDGHGFDARSESIVDVLEAGIVDSAGVLRTSVHEAIASAALALTVDVLVHKKHPEMSFEP